MSASNRSRRGFLRNMGAFGATATLAHAGSSAKTTPNIVVIFIDDMGYGDVGCFGSKNNRTPKIDRMAAEGIRFTDFYVACSVCTPSRAALLTGCYPQRMNIHENEEGLCVLFPANSKGLNPREITIAEILKERGYRTACIGKWHLGDQPAFLPTRQGFDYYFGIPYSNDMGQTKKWQERPPLPLMRNEEVIEAPVEQDHLTQRYTKEAIQFIKESNGQPFFLYLPHAMVHLPLAASEAFKNKSANGIYGDAVEELDWSTGEILKTLRELGIDDNTLVVFTSDNGSTGRFGGNNLPLGGHKGQTDEGGMRVPCIMRFPGIIPAGQVNSEVCGTIDLLPTIAGLCGGKVPSDRAIDGKNILPLMTGAPGAKSPHEAFYYYQLDQLQCVRSGKWKLHLPQKAKKRNWGKPDADIPLKLFNLEADIAETKNLAAEHPEIVEKLRTLAEKMKKDLGNDGAKGTGQRAAAFVENPKPQLLKKQ